MAIGFSFLLIDSQVRDSSVEFTFCDGLFRMQSGYSRLFRQITQQTVDRYCIKRQKEDSAKPRVIFVISL